MSSRHMEKCLKKGMRVSLWPPGVQVVEREGSIFRKESGQGQITSVISLLSWLGKKQLRKGRVALVHSLRVGFLMAGQAQHQGLEEAVRIDCTHIPLR